MGRYSSPLATAFATFASLPTNGRVLDVGCGPGALTAELVHRLGPDRVTAVDPSPTFVAAARDRLPGVEVHEAPAEAMPFADATFDAALAQLVVHFMNDPVAGLAEMSRVVRPGGVVAACVWDFAGGGAPLALFWDVAREQDPSAPGEDALAGATEGQLSSLLERAGLREVVEERIEVEVSHPSFDEWWEPYTFGVGPAGVYVGSLDGERVEALREACRRRLPPAPFTIGAAAWAARARG
jgi:ubiquinone/menaquinone biosynthesis C-methylase UbiE